MNKNRIAVSFPTQSTKSRCNRSHILFNNMRVLCTTCTPSIFQFFDLKYILPKTFFQNKSLVLKHVCVTILVWILFICSFYSVLCLYLWARACSSVICIAITSFKSLWCDCIFFMYSRWNKTLTEVQKGEMMFWQNSSMHWHKNTIWRKCCPFLLHPE